MIRLENVSFTYENEEVLKDISFDVFNKEFVGIIGANGGGKSTTLKLILGLLTPKSGKININNAKLGYVPQSSKINPNFPISVLDVVLMGCVSKYSFFFASKKEKQKAIFMLEKLGLKGYEDKKFINLSGGQKQRVLIARALLANSNILLLDEPTASIDSKGQIEVFETLKSLNDEGKAIICVCHDISLLSSYADKIVHINKTCHIHSNVSGINKAKLKHLLSHKDNLCEIDIWENYGISKI